MAKHFLGMGCCAVLRLAKHWETAEKIGAAPCA